MKKGRLLSGILGVILLVMGIFLLDRMTFVGILLFFFGFSALILSSIGWMRISGKVKENYLQMGGVASERFQTQEAAPTNADIWDELCQKKGE